VRDGVHPGRQIVAVTDEAYGHAVAALFLGAGIDVSVLDRRSADKAHADAVAIAVGRRDPAVAADRPHDVLRQHRPAPPAQDRRPPPLLISNAQ
jgi:hypothetical protein